MNTSIGFRTVGWVVLGAMSWLVPWTSGCGGGQATEGSPDASSGGSGHSGHRDGTSGGTSGSTSDAGSVGRSGGSGQLGRSGSTGAATGSASGAAGGSGAVVDAGVARDAALLADMGVDASGDTSAGDAPGACWGDGGGLVPEAKDCERDSDCTTVQDRKCCGNSRVVGIAKARLEFAACYPTPGCPGSGCPTALLAEDGEEVRPGTVQVQCVSVNGRKQCSTSGPRTDAGVGAACSIDRECASGLKCCYPCGIQGCTPNRCTVPGSDGRCPLLP